MRRCLQGKLAIFGVLRDRRDNSVLLPAFGKLNKRTKKKKRYWERKLRRKETKGALCLGKSLEKGVDYGGLSRHP